MAQSDARFGYRAKLKREDHDLSRPFGFTCCPGQLLPIFADIATPGDSYYIKHDLTFLRTRPLAAPAMVDLKVHYESFFIPMQMIYQPFENTIFSLKNLQSSNYNMANLQNNNFPLFAYGVYVGNFVSDATNQQSSAKLAGFRLADLLDLNADNFAQDGRTLPIQYPRYEYLPSFFPWQILAYNTIYEYYFRLDDKSQFDNSLCNFDQYYGSSSPVSISNLNFMTIHQRPWKFDYFTSLYRGPIVSDANLQRVLNDGSYSSLVSALQAGLSINGVYGSSLLNSQINSFGDKPQSSGSPNLYDVSRSSSSANIRQIFANEKLAMITGRTKKNYDSQVLAHYGVSVPHDVKHDITLIAHDEYPVHIGEVTSLASTSDAGLGDLAGKGWSQSPDSIKQHKFTAPCHGVVMTIFSVEPLQRYYGGFNKINSVVNAFDIPTPEFDRLGNMPMFRYEAGSKTSGMGDSDIIGWKERYYFNKRRSPKTTLAFQNPTHSYQGTNSMMSYFISNQPFANNSALPNVGRPDLAGEFYIPSTAMNNLMLVPYTPYWKDGYVSGTFDPDAENWNKTPWLAYARDPFIVDSFEKVTKISWMSKDGEPVYDF